MFKLPAERPSESTTVEQPRPNLLLLPAPAEASPPAPRLGRHGNGVRRGGHSAP